MFVEYIIIEKIDNWIELCVGGQYVQMLILDLLNVLFDQSDYDALVILRSLGRRKTNYGNKYSLLRYYGIINEPMIHKLGDAIKSICKLGPIKIIKHIIMRINNRNVLLHWSEETSNMISKYLVGVCDIGDDDDGNRVVYLSSEGDCDLHFCVEDCALHYSAENGHLEAVKYLVSIGANVHFDYEKTLQSSALEVSAKSGHLGVVKYLVSVGANIHTNNDYALELSAKHGHLGVVKYLVDIGADIHVDNGYALRWSAEYGHLEVVKYLISVGANIHTHNDYALGLSAYYGHLEIVKYLIDVGANVCAKNNHALRFSAESGHLEVVKYLISIGANIHVNNDQLFRIKMIRDNFGHLQ